MIFVVNIGNTNIACGLRDGNEWKELWRFTTDERKTADEYLLLIESALASKSVEPKTVEKTVVGTVVPELEKSFEAVGLGLFRRRPFIVGPRHTAGLRVAIDNPRELGTDLLADAVAAYHLAGTSCVIADFGTALSFTAVDAGGIIRGAAIAPGIGTAIKALAGNTAKLPRVPLEAPPRAIGTDTITAIQSGIVFGYVGLVEHMVERLAGELAPPVQVVATGGYASVLSGHTSCFHLTDPWLTLDGLRLIAEYEERDRP